MASIIRIKRSTVSGNPATLAAGELAYSGLTDNGSNGGDRLYIGLGTETDGNAANHYVIGGKYFTDMLDHTRGTLTANSAILVDVDSKIDQIKVGNITVTGSTNTIITANTNANLNLTPNGSGSVVISKMEVSGKTNLNSVSNVTITGGSSGQFLQTDGAGNLSFASFAVEAGSSIVNGTSNVSVALNSNVTVSVAGNANVLTITGTGANISGTANVSGNVNVGNLGASTVVASTANVGTLSLSGYEITSTGTNQNISLNPNGTGNVDVNTSYVINVKDPVNAQDAATKKYVDDMAAGIHAHFQAQAATTANLATLTGGTVTYDNGTDGVGATLTLSVALTTLDTSYSLQNGDRILVKDEATASHNGVYIWATGGLVLTRADDFNTPAEIAGGDFVFIENGTQYNNTGWVQTEKVTSVGSSDIIFIQFSGSGTYTAGTGLTLSGTQFSIATNYVGQSSITTLGNVTTGTWSANVVAYNYGGTGQSSYAKGDIIYASAINTLSKLSANVDGQVLQLSSGVPVWADLDGGTY